MVRKQQVDQVLAGVALFSACPRASSARWQDCAPRSTCLLAASWPTKASTDTSSCGVARGSAVVTINGETIAVLGAGDFFGEIALLDGGRRTATVTAETDLVVEVISQADFYSLLTNAPSVTRRILAHLGGRLRATDLQLAARGTSHATSLAG